MKLAFSEEFGCRIPSAICEESHGKHFKGVKLPGKEHPMELVVNLIYDEEHQGYAVDVPQLPGCMSQGKTIQSALTNARKAIQLYLKEEGSKRLRRVPEVITSQIEVSI